MYFQINTYICKMLSKVPDPSQVMDQYSLNK